MAPGSVEKHTEPLIIRNNYALFATLVNRQTADRIFIWPIFLSSILGQSVTLAVVLGLTYIPCGNLHSPVWWFVLHMATLLCITQLLAFIFNKNFNFIQIKHKEALRTGSKSVLWIVLKVVWIFCSSVVFIWHRLQSIACRAPMILRTVRRFLVHNLQSKKILFGLRRFSLVCESIL